MMEKKKEKEQNQNLTDLDSVLDYSNIDRRAKFKDLLKTIALLLLVVCLGLFVVNQTMGYYYKAHFLKSPCSLCAELNPNQSMCIKDCFTYQTKLYPDGFGGWVKQGDINLSNID